MEKSVRAIIGLMTVIAVTLLMTSLAMTLRDYIKHERFLLENFMEFSPIHYFVSGLFLLMTVIHYFIISGPLVPMPCPRPVRFNRQRREVAYITKYWRRPRFASWEDIVACVSTGEAATVYGTIKFAYLTIGLEGKSGGHASWITVPTHTRELALSEWEIIRAYMEKGVDALPLPMRPGNVEEGTVEHFHMRRRYYRSEGDYLRYLFNFLPVQFLSGWTLPCYIAAGVTRLPFIRLPKSIFDWSAPLPREQWQAPSAELIAQSEEVRKSLRKGMSIFDYFLEKEKNQNKAGV
ncbi:Uncharacterized protein ALO44_03314 [Pseudomonas syringae pv. tagetis]|uniref:DUF6708 domain-containing protein n=1 Tax=Pseudomonas syringae pv. tagetis TaxID=129140 RepID=A0A0N8T286_9PSED|nr:Uncharacterized protein ALO44_03314 [Pseudomonas syringae pv. tagetis]